MRVAVKNMIFTPVRYACRVPSQQDTMEIFIKESDEIMYRNKVINKINRGEALR